MAYEYSELLAQAQDWAHDAIAQGYLKQSDAQPLLTLDQRSPEQLFITDNSASRPLIVAFIGGTGVGKSSLLNRLAGQAVAKAGVERPTSREVTLYHHQSLQLQHLPGSLPLAKTRISQHDNSQNAHIVWIDMPDFDSVEQANKALVFEWLPHIDVLVYVVSPERYRDNKAWQLLQAEGGKHAWLFVMNQWDRAVTSQFEDFKQQLSKAGFADPLVLYTSCIEPESDRFSELLEQLYALSSEQAMRQMTQHNIRLRMQGLVNRLQAFLCDLNRQDFNSFREQSAGIWLSAEATIQQGLAWNLKAHAETLANRSTADSENKLWDVWAQSRLSDVLEELLQQADQAQIAIKPMRAKLEQINQWATKNAATQIELAGRAGMLNPGNKLQRFLLRLTAICETLLPIVAMAIVAYQVFIGYYQSTHESIAYLGVDFAVHSILLIGLSWLIPFFLHKKLQPSLQKAALSGLNKGLRQVLLQLQFQIEQSLTEVEHGNQICIANLVEIIERAAQENDVALVREPLLIRVLVGN